MSESTVDSADGTVIAYTAWGEGEPVVIVDGATAYARPCDAVTLFTTAAAMMPEDAVTGMREQDFWPALAAGSRAVAAQLPTATLETVPGEQHSTTPDVLANALRQFIKEH